MTTTQESKLYIIRISGKGKAARIHIGDEDDSFPLTAYGCREAGEYLFEIGAIQWLYSSSCDFPEEYKRGFKHDVRSLVMEGYRDSVSVQFPYDNWIKDVNERKTELGYGEWVESKLEERVKNATDD